MQAVVLSVGSELLRGDIVDTNAAFLTRQLSEMGVEVSSVLQIGDELPHLSATFSEAHATADIVISSGGLGPTEDDLTREAIALAVSEELFVDDSLAANLEARFTMLRRTMPQSNLRQAMRILSADSLPNPNGTAPGWFVRHDGRVIAALPGPPREMQPMWTEQVESRLAPLLSGHRAVASLMTFGIGESMVERQIVDVIHWHPTVTVATYAKTAGVQVHVTARAADSAEADHLRNETERMLRDRLGSAIFGTGSDTLATAVGTLLTQRSMTLAVMESCTGGELATILTDRAGSSDFFVGGVVAYSRRVKEHFGVDPTVLDRYGLISKETALEMARAARLNLGASSGIGTTGVAGSVAVEDKPPGTCFIATSVEGADEVREIHRPGERDIIKHYFAQCALDLLRRQLPISEKVAT